MITYLSGSGRARSLREPSVLRRILILATAIVLASSFMWAFPSSTDSASAAITAPAVAQCNSVDNTPGLGINCTVAVNNFYDVSSGAGSATVTVTECHGSAGVPTAACATATSYHQELITSVSQCNTVLNGGGGRGICSVAVINTITGDATPTAATIRQCQDSGDSNPLALLCSPIGNTTNATITQCNNSVNGDATPLRVICTVGADSTQTSAVPVSINQCNYAADGGGASMTCTASITNRVLPVAVIPSDTPSVAPSESASPTPSESPSATPTDSASPTPTDSASPTPTATATTGGGGSGEADVSDTLAATGLDVSPTILFGAVVLLFAGSLVLLTRNQQRRPRVNQSAQDDRHE